VLIQVGGVGPAEGPGMLEIARYIDPCCVHPDDAFEGNDECASAVSLPRGKSAELFVMQADDAWYRVTVPPLITVFLQALVGHL